MNSPKTLASPDPSEDLHHLLGAAALAAPGAVDQVGEQHGDIGEAVGDHVIVLLEPGGEAAPPTATAAVD
jgi:hypothetical protein